MLKVTAYTGRTSDKREGSTEASEYLTGSPVGFGGWGKASQRMVEQGVVGRLDLHLLFFEKNKANIKMPIVKGLIYISVSKLC